MNKKHLFKRSCVCYPKTNSVQSPKRFKLRQEIIWKKRENAFLMRSGLVKRHLELHSASLISAPFASSSVASPPSITAHPPVSRRNSLIRALGSSTPNPITLRRERTIVSYPSTKMLFTMGLD